MKKTTKPATASKTVKSVTATKAVTALATKLAKAPAKKSAPAKKKASATTAPLVTSISAKIDIGFGNHLYLRGEGPGLSWDKGIAMESGSNVLWNTTIIGATAPVVFKLLVNDISWSTGKDYVIEPGQSVTVTPTF